MAMGKDAVIILSGGMDSTTMLYEFRDEIALAITFDYGSLQNKREQKFADMHCKKLGIKHIIIPLEFMGKYFKSSLLMSPDDIPEGRYDDENMRSTVVPFRNGIMLAVACAMSAGTYENVELCAPYTGLSKTDIALRGKRLGINYAETYSCYKGGEVHCGKCGTCQERREALQAAGIDDPTPYQS